MRTEVELQIHRRNFEIDLDRHLRHTAHLREFRDGQRAGGRGAISGLAVIAQQIRAIRGAFRVREATAA